jgi:hypothetical protein
MGSDCINPSKTTIPDERRFSVRGEGGSSAITTVGASRGVTLTRVNTGAYRVTVDEDHPGYFRGVNHSLLADTLDNLAGHTVIFKGWDATNKRLDFAVYNNPDSGTGGTPARHDLAADEYVWVELVFSQNEQ